MRFTSFIYKNLSRRPLRTGLTLFAFSTAIASVVALLGISKGFVRAFEDVYTSHSVDVVISRQGSADRLSSSVDESIAERAAEIPGVERTAAVLLDTLSFEDQELYGVPAMGVAADSWLTSDYVIVSQAGPGTFDGPTLRLGIHLAERMGVEAGETVNLFEEPYLVLSVFQSRSSWENGSVLLPLPQLQSITDRDHQVTFVNVVLDSDLSADQVSSAIESIESLDQKLLAMTTDEFVSTDTRMRVASAMAWMTSFIALVIGGIGTLNTMMTSVLERTVEIGILRAVGWPRWRVAKMILMESIGIALVASFIGAILAVIGTSLLSQADAVKGIVSPSIDSAVLLQGLALAVGIGVAGALLPAWRATQMLPTEAFSNR